MDTVIDSSVYQNNMSLSGFTVKRYTSCLCCISVRVAAQRVLAAPENSGTSSIKLHL